MNADELLLEVFSISIVVLFAISGTFFCIFLERFLAARIQHRDGPGIGGRIDYFQVWKDFRKIRAKGHSAPAKLKPFYCIWMVLPIAFLVLLLGRNLPDGYEEAGLWILCSLVLLSISIEAMLIHFSSSGRERLEWRAPILLKILGISALCLSGAALAMHVGGANLAQVSAFQAKFPFHSMFASPGLFVLGLIAFASIYPVVGDGPILANDEKSLKGELQYGIFFNKRMWAFSLLCFWIYFFLGGFDGIIAKILFPLKAMVFSIGYVLLKVSVPYVRSSDAGALALRWLLTFGFLGFAVEVIWVGFGI